MFGIEIKSVKEGNKLISLNVEVYGADEKLAAKASAVLDHTSEIVVLKYEGELYWAKDTAEAVNEWLQDNFEKVEFPDWF
jgi:hypothetical protein